MKEGEKLPEVSKVEDIKEDGKIVIVQFDLYEYNKKWMRDSGARI